MLDDFANAKKILHEIVEVANYMLMDFITHAPPPPPPVVNPLDVNIALETEEEPPATEEPLATASDGSNWETVFDASMAREGKVCLMTYLGGPCGGYAADVAGSLWG
jgi:hypothetical protein